METRSTKNSSSCGGSSNAVFKKFGILLVSLIFLGAAMSYYDPHLNFPVVSQVVCSLKGDTWYGGGLLDSPAATPRPRQAGVTVNRVRVCLAVACAVALSGCGADGSSQSSGGNAAQSTSAASSVASSDCLLGANGADVEVGIGNPTQSCAQWITDLAGSGLVWQLVGQMVPPGSPGTADGEAMEQACDLTANGGEEFYVEDVGDQFYGDSICSQEEQNGWTPESSPGPLAVIEQQQGEAAASASASASAAASQAQTVSNAQSSLANDVSALVSDTATLNNDTSLASDISQMKQDYAQEQSDWQTEQNTACSTDQVGGDADTVGGDADTVGGDLDSLNGDVTDLQAGDIKSVQTDLSNVASDLSTLQGLGAAPGTPSSAAVAAGKKALTSAANAISWANGQGQKINAEAQALATTAQNYASSHCG
jgi:hypothetical protein